MDTSLKAGLSTKISDPKPKKKKKLWRIVEDKTSGAEYYYNRSTKETTWTRPSDEELLKDYYG